MQQSRAENSKGPGVCTYNLQKSTPISPIRLWIHPLQRSVAEASISSPRKLVFDAPSSSSIFVAIQTRWYTIYCWIFNLLRSNDIKNSFRVSCRCHRHTSVCMGHSWTFSQSVLVRRLLAVRYLSETSHQTSVQGSRTAVGGQFCGSLQGRKVNRTEDVFPIPSSLFYIPELLVMKPKVCRDLEWWDRNWNRKCCVASLRFVSVCAYVTVVYAQQRR
jgi:hypothetical protein